MRKADLILPFYKPHAGWNEHILESLKPLRAFLHEHDTALRLILANDGSPLSMYPQEILDSLHNASDEFLFSTYEVNHGKGYCLRCAVSQADGDFIFYTDGDFPFGYKCIEDAFLRLEDGADVVMGVRGTDYSRALHPHRKMISQNVRSLNRFLLGLPQKYLDTQAGMKAFRKGAGRDAFLATTVDTFLFDTEFILLAWDRGLRIDTIPLQLREGLSFSKMGMKVLVRELRHFMRILPVHWMREKVHRSDI